MRRDRTPVGAPRQRRQNLLRAGLLLAGVRRPTRKNLAHAARVLRTLGIERPLNPEEPYRGVILQLRDAVVFERLPIVLLDHVKTGPEVRGQEGGAHLARASLHRDCHFQDSVALICSHSLTCSHALVLEQMRSLAVDDELELLAWNEAADPEVLDRKLVLAVGRKVVAYQHAAARAKRQTLDVLILRRIAGRKIGGLRRRLPIAHRHAGDPCRRGCIGLQECWRDRQRTRDVVKAPGRIVRRQQRRDIDLEIQQVAHRIRVFGPVQTMEDDGARIDTSCRFAIDFRFEPIPESLVLRQLRPLHARWRHHARAKLAHDFLPQLRMVTRSGEV